MLGRREQGGESDSMGGGRGREGPGEHRKVLWSLALQDESESREESDSRVTGPGD